MTLVSFQTIGDRLRFSVKTGVHGSVFMEFSPMERRCFGRDQSKSEVKCARPCCSVGSAPSIGLFHAPKYEEVVLTIQPLEDALPLSRPSRRFPALHTRIPAGAGRAKPDARRPARGAARPWGGGRQETASLWRRVTTAGVVRILRMVSISTSDRPVSRRPPGPPERTRPGAPFVTPGATGPCPLFRISPASNPVFGRVSTLLSRTWPPVIPPLHTQRRARRTAQPARRTLGRR